MRDLRARLAERSAQQLYRRRVMLDGPQGPEIIVGGTRLLSFCSNDYLGLAADVEVQQAFRDGVDAWGAGSGAAHLVTGHSRVHHELEEALAAFTGRQRALLFSTGYMANLGVIAALAGRGDRVFEDRLNHASLIDGARLSDARLVRYAHADVRALSDALAVTSAGDGLVATDGVFSMDGDVAPLDQLARVCRENDAWLMVDDAHGIGVHGPDGRGSVAAAGLDSGQVPVLVGTLGKALGTFGAFVAGDDALIEALIQFARPWIYTTALPPAVAAATLASLQRVQRDQWRRDRLATLVERFRKGARQLGLQLMPSSTPIQPLLTGDAATALRISEQLRERDILVTPIRPPTVPEDTARLRITFSALHTDAHVDRLLDVLGTTARASMSGRQENHSPGT